VNLFPPRRQQRQAALPEFGPKRGLAHGAVTKEGSSRAGSKQARGASTAPLGYGAATAALFAATFMIAGSARSLRGRQSLSAEYIFAPSLPRLNRSVLFKGGARAAGCSILGVGKHPPRGRAGRAAHWVAVQMRRTYAAGKPCGGRRTGHRSMVATQGVVLLERGRGPLCRGNSGGIV